MWCLNKERNGEKMRVKKEEMAEEKEGERCERRKEIKELLISFGEIV